MMHMMRRGMVILTMVFLFSLTAIYKLALAEDTPAKNPGAQKTGYASKKPVFGGACRTCPWGSIAEIVKAAMQPYGYDIQICYTCAGGPREARIVAGAMMPTPPRESAEVPLYLTPPPPTAPVNFGATGSQFRWWDFQRA